MFTFMVYGDNHNFSINDVDNIKTNLICYKCFLSNDIDLFEAQVLNKALFLDFRLYLFMITI